MIHVSGKHGVVGVTPTPAILNMFPSAKVVTLQGNSLAVLRHSFAETKFLRTQGLDVPSPVLSQYNWPHPANEPPFDVQRKTVAMLTTEQRAYVLNGMGTGKTRCILWAFDFLKMIGQAKKVIISAPISTLHFTWAREVFRCFPHLKYSVVFGDKKRRIKKLAEDADVYIINPDGLLVMREEIAARDDIDCIVLDELAEFRNSRGEKNKCAQELVKTRVWAWGLTGSPTPSAPTDAYGQCLILTPHTVPKRFSHFRDAVMLKVGPFRWVPKANAKDHVFSVMQPAVRFTLEDVIELPDVIERTVDIDLGKKQEAVYNALRDEAYLLAQNHEITAANAGDVLNKLLQVSNGYVYAKKAGSTDREVLSLDNGNRLQQLLDDVNACDEKVIVFAPYTHTIKGIAEHLAKHHIDIAVIDGSTPAHERGQIFNAFQNSSKYKVIVAHPGTMAHGVTLTAATCIIWFGPVTSLEIFEQANARIRRIGQKLKQLILMYQSTPAEKRMYSNLRAKQRVQDGLLRLFAEAQL